MRYFTGGSRAPLRRIIFCGLVLVASMFAIPVLGMDGIGSVIELSSMVGRSGPIDAQGLGLQSVRMQVKTPHLSGYAIFDFAANKEKFVAEQGGASTVLYAVGDVLYSQDPSGAWMKVDAGSFKGMRMNQPVPAASKNSATQWTHKRVLADRMLNGVLMGAVNFDVPVRSIDAQLSHPEVATVTCLYEKANSRPRLCTAPNVLRLSFDRFNDARNDIRVPPDALKAKPFRAETLPK